MSLTTRTLPKLMFETIGRMFGTAAYAVDNLAEPIQPFRTSQNNPVYHNESHYCRFYTVPHQIYTNTALVNGLPRELKEQTHTFTELSILIRKPALEVISYLNEANYNKSINRYVLYGETGTGKTMSLIHIIHYALSKQMLLLHVPWPSTWFRFPKETAPSPLVPDMFDLPFEAGTWLKYFRDLNGQLLSRLSLRISKEYTWSKRESTRCGTPLLEFIDFGITRIKFACAVIAGLIEELKAACTAEKCKMLVAIDGYNAFLAETTASCYENRQVIPAKKFTLTKAFLDSVNHDWCNGAAVLTLSTRATKERRESVLPLYLLGQDGFEYLDPFLPIGVNNYTDTEADTVLEYYKNRKWITNISADGEKELKLLSNKNPRQLLTRCGAI